MTTQRDTTYVLGAATEEQRRLLKQATGLKPEAAWLLDQIGVQPGWRVADVGCGPIGIVDLLSERVGSTGAVIGIEREPEFAEMAAASARSRGWRNVEILCADVVANGASPDAFDLVHERLVLHLQRDPAAFLGRMIAMTRPGGFVAVESVDSAVLLCEPSHPAWLRLWDVILSACRVNEVDAYFGRRVPGLLREAGLIDIRVRAHVTVASQDDFGRDVLLALATSLRPLIVELGLMSDIEVDEHLAAVADHLGKPNTLVMGPLLVQAWARKPETV